MNTEKTTIAEHLVNVILAFWVCVMVAIGTVLFVDALEHGKTGACRECLIIPIFRPGINFIAGDE